MKKNLTLTGMMGVGKSTIGKALSRRLLMRFSDIDKLVEEKLNMSIQQIFEEKGEYFFRQFEEKITIMEVKKKEYYNIFGWWSFYEF